MALGATQNGHVLLVDDIQINLYITEEMITPYVVKIETAASGFEAIDKIESGSVYDIVFMDCIMPEMDGIETARRMRAMGYAKPIVALTGDAVTGDDELFLSVGFDDCVPKPVELNQIVGVLKKHIAYEQPPDIEINVASASKDAKDVNPRLAEIFIKEAGKAISKIESFTDIRNITIYTHAMKSALKSVGEFELADMAAELERAGRNNDTAVIRAEIPLFLSKLKAVTEKLRPQNGNTAVVSEADIDYEFLREKLFVISKACEIYDKKTAKKALAELKERAWPENKRETLDAIADYLLSGDFDEVVRAVNCMVEDIG